MKTLIAALCLGAALTSCAADGEQPSALGYHGVEPEPAPARPSFVLTDTLGDRYDFHARTKGRPTYLYFGYTFCPDECPTAMADISAALRKVGSRIAGKAVVILVTTDPRRDSPAILREFLDQFSTEFIGLTGTPEEIATAQRAAGVQVATPGPPQPTLPGQPNAHPKDPGNHKHTRPLGYSVNHSAVILAYDADDRLPVLYPGGVTPQDIADDLPLLLDPARAPKK